MKKPSSQQNRVCQTNGRRLAGALAGLVLAGGLVTAQAQIQTAGSLFVNVDATALSAGVISSVTNSGALGGYFVATNVNALNSSVWVTNLTAGGPNALYLGALGSTNYLRLFNTSDSSGSLIRPPAGLVGSNATCSIEVWAFNPAVAGEETMVSWGARYTGLNMAFLYGNNNNSGAVQHYGGADLSWDAKASGGAPQSQTWHHLVYTSDGTNELVYVDGALVNQQAPVASYNTTNNSGIALGAQWNLVGGITNVSTWASLGLARVRVHEEALTSAQVLANFNAEKATFLTTTPQYLTRQPTHRYSFNEAATNDASGLAFHDSIAGADGIVQGSEANIVAQFSGRRMILPGGLNIPTANYGAPYGDLPNGLISANSANNGGSGEFSVEIWYKNYGGAAWSWSRIFDAGSSGTLNVGNEITGPGNFTSGWSARDDFQISAQNGGSLNQRRLEWKNYDSSPSGSTTNSSTVNADAALLGTYQTDQHVVVTWKESTGQIIAYGNGQQMTSMIVSNAMSALNDVNVWLGRSVNSDNGTAAEYDEVRFYDYVLSPSQVLGDFQVGPDTVNTAAQAATILVQPQGTSVYQGWPASFYVTASGSPAVSYQWMRNGTAIPGATTDTYKLAAAGLTNNGDSYSCVISNYANSTPTVLTSGSATLAVTANQAPPAAVLHETRDANPSATTRNQRNEYDGTVGGVFQVGATGALVTHLGMYDYNNNTDGIGLNRDHLVSLYTASGTPALVASVTVPAGASGYVTNNYRYAALATPVYLLPNTSYILDADVYASDGDMWADGWNPALWSSYFVGSTASSTRGARYGSHGYAATGTYNAGTYGAPNMAALPMGPAVIAAAQTNVTVNAGQNATLTVAADGQAPVSVQWYRNNALLTGQTNSTLVFTNLLQSDSSTFYAIASNDQGYSQSASIVLTVLDNPVEITQQPTNMTVLEGYGVTFYLAAFGSLPISYQWRSNDVPILDATNAVFTISTVALAQNGVNYSCVVSNYANASAHIVASSEATLTVIPNKAAAPQLLFQPPTSPMLRDDYSGVVGGVFKSGSTPAMVTHLGYFAANSGLNYPHHVGIFDSNSTLVASVFITGTGSVQTNGYFWVPLDTPLVLATNASYVLAAEVYAGDGDGWPDSFTPSPWNSYYVGSNDGTTRSSRYTGSSWPALPSYGSSADHLYAAANMAVLPIGAPTVFMAQSSITQYEGLTAEFDAFVNGDSPVSVQWYKSPGTLLTGQTTTSLVFPSLAITDSGTYYLVAQNGTTSTQGQGVTLQVLAQAAPSIVQAPQSQAVYVNQAVYFNVVASGTPPFTYQWSYNGAPIPGATTSALQLSGVTTAAAGIYGVVVSNSVGYAPASANLTVVSPASGSYAAAVLAAMPLVYYPFSDATNGATSTFNMGSLGTPWNGSYEGDFSGATGPQPPAFSQFDTNNQALVLNGSNVDVVIPALNLDTNSGPNVTLAAWVNSQVNPNLSTVGGNYAQGPDSGIIFYRGTGGASGIGVKTNMVAGMDMLEYHWANTYYSFDSGLFLPTNQWTFVALVVEPSRATLYLNSGAGMQTATNNASHAAVPFSSALRVGWDTWTSTRRFSGEIDEPMIFARSLSVDEIQALYQGQVLSGTVTLEMTRISPTQFVLSWPSGTLQQSAQVGGTYSDMTGVTSPYTNTITGAQQFYRVKVR